MAASGRKFLRKDKGIQGYRHLLQKNHIQLLGQLALRGGNDRLTVSVHRP